MTLWKALPLFAVALFLGKLFFRTRLRAWGATIDRWVNVLLVALAVGYGLGLVLHFTR